MNWWIGHLKYFLETIDLRHKTAPSHFLMLMTVLQDLGSLCSALFDCCSVFQKHAAFVGLLSYVFCLKSQNLETRN